MTEMSEYGKPMSESELAGIIQNMISTSTGADQDDITGERSKALDYYFGRSPGAVGDGRSSAVSTDVADTVEALLAQIMPSFSEDSVATFEALGPQDDKQAQLESDFVNYQIMERNDGFRMFYQAIKDALILRNGILKIYIEEKEKIVTQTYPDATTETMQMLLMENPNRTFNTTDRGLEVKTMTPLRRLKVEAVDVNKFVVKSDTRSVDMQECDFCAQSHTYTQTDLLEMGYDPLVVDELLQTDDTDTQVSELARNQSDTEDTHYWYERSLRPIEVWESYIVVDYDGDGVGELRRVISSNRTILENEPVQWVPYAVGTPFINAHRWVGISLFDKLREIQNQKTQVLRQYIDNMYYNNNRRSGLLENAVNLEDWTNSLPGGGVRMKRPDAIVPLPVDDIGPSCIQLMTYLDKMRSERAGASLDMQTEGMTVGGDTAHGVERQMSFKEMLAALITKTLAETLIKQTYLLVHKTMKAFMAEPMQARIGGQWQQTNPAEWQEREHVSIDVGMSPSERTRQSQALLTVLSQQVTAMQQGLEGVLVTPAQIYNTLIDYCRCYGLSAPDQYWTDPASPPAQQAGMQKSMAAQQERAKTDRYAQSVIDIEAFKAQSEALKDARDYEFQVAERLLESEEKQAEIDQSTEELNEAQRDYESGAKPQGE